MARAVLSLEKEASLEEASVGECQEIRSGQEQDRN